MSKEQTSPAMSPYLHGAYLSSILGGEEETVDGEGLGRGESLLALAAEHIEVPTYPSTPPVSTLPSELLSKIFLEVVDHPFTSPRSLPFKAAAVDLLSISSASSTFRQVATHDSALWAKVPFLNGINRNLLDLILRRSQQQPLTLRFSEDSTLPGTVDIWSLIMTEYWRVAALYIEVAESFEGIKSKTLLVMRSPALQYCFVKFHGQRNVRLDDLISNNLPPFGGEAPVLRSLDLTNCSLSPILFTFPTLTDLTVTCEGDTTTIRPFLLLQDCIQWRYQIHFLRSLKLVHCILPCNVAKFHELLLGPPLHLPILEELVFAGSMEACYQLGSILRIPDECTRDVTVKFHRDRQYESPDANIAASASLVFIPTGVKYLECSVSIIEGAKAYLRLFRAGNKYETLSFDVAQLDFQIAGVISFLIAALSIPSLPIHPTSPTDLFLRLLFDGLSRQLGPTLSSIPSLHLSFGIQSPAPHILRGFLNSMARVQKLSVEHMDVWDNPCFLSYHAKGNFPRLKRLEVPLNESTTPATMIGLTAFLKHRIGMKGVLFKASHAWVAEMGYAAVEEVPTIVGSLTEHFPPSISVDWAEAWV
ncbi:hypothetical protein DFP72DRAFT_495675 [Ephemerocybe angulata]|uniref:F-box domain-containing protein n=1 Tax=Ephemerocybe angulata TaxID=980116 RepID=A0A8H6M4L0_9AGAR|nr:hypothetical protein DFP72DRAFT_495675 [Tulosesus angulatus]